MGKFNGTHLNNKDLVLIYNYLQEKISRAELSEKLGRTRTNTYYYIGAAVHYWIKRGLLRFRRIKDTDELGGRDIT